MDWEKLRAFAASAESGSLTAAAERLGLSQSALSRKVAALERDLSTPLFHRHARGLVPTGPGQLLLDVVKDVALRLDHAERRIRDSGARPVGDLTVTAPVALGAMWLTPRLQPFLNANPELDLRLVLDDRELDLGMLEADVAIRPWTPTQPDLIRRRLFTMTTHLYAAEGFFDGEPPTSVDEIDPRHVLALGREAPSWMRRADWLGEDRRHHGRPALECTSYVGLAQAAQAGLGVASLPDYLAAAAPGLRRVLPDRDGPSFDVFMVYAAELKRSKRLLVLGEFLSEEARRWSECAGSQ